VERVVVGIERRRAIATVAAAGKSSLAASSWVARWSSFSGTALARVRMNRSLLACSWREARRLLLVPHLAMAG
jgi:hypothetical protein